MKRIASFLMSCVFFIAVADAQQAIGVKKELRIPVRAEIVDGDTIPVIDLEPIQITANMVFKNAADAYRYERLKHDVEVVYPYAVLAAAKLKEYNAKLARMPFEAERKIYMKQTEKELKKQFGSDLKNLTVNQGRILIKLIDRQTGETTFEIVKDLRGAFPAFMWQTLARVFGSNLKSSYDAQGEDRRIEQIIDMIQSGRA